MTQNGQRKEQSGSLGEKIGNEEDLWTSGMTISKKQNERDGLALQYKETRENNGVSVYPKINKWHWLKKKEKNGFVFSDPEKPPSNNLWSNSSTFWI